MRDYGKSRQVHTQSNARSSARQSIRRGLDISCKLIRHSQRGAEVPVIPPDGGQATFISFLSVSA
eukprot:1671969-Pleurochrysis_carterae.AAC.2